MEDLADNIKAITDELSKIEYDGRDVEIDIESFCKGNVDVDAIAQGVANFIKDNGLFKSVLGQAEVDISVSTEKVETSEPTMGWMTLSNDPFMGAGGPAYNLDWDSFGEIPNSMTAENSDKAGDSSTADFARIDRLLSDNNGIDTFEQEWQPSTQRIVKH